MADMKEKKVLLRLQNLKMHFPIKKSSIFDKQQYVRAVDGITVDIYEGETFGLVGESGCGKSTLGRVILQLYKQTEGTVLYGGQTFEDYSPAYLLRIIRGIRGIPAGMSPEEMIEQYPEQVALAGGMLLWHNMADLERSMVAQFNQIKKQSKLSHDLHLLEIQLAELTEREDITPAEIRKKAELAISIGKKKDAKAAATRAFASEQKRLDDIREACSTAEGYQLLQSKLNHMIDLGKLTGEEMRTLRRDMQMVFQDPYSSLNPRLTVGQLISEALVAHDMFQRGSNQAEKYTLSTMDKCGLQKYMLHRYPHQFSGGQRQRIGIARALALQPKFVVCDEAVSALDVSIQSQIINLLMDLKDQNQLTYLFISHDLSTVKFISDRIGVMYLGDLVELASSDTIFVTPLHPYTEALLSAIPTTEEDANKELQTVEGDIPSSINPPTGCKFHTRCKYATEKCAQERPEWRECIPGHFVACHYPLVEKSEV